MIFMRTQGFVAAGLVALIVLACYHQQNSEGVWRVTFGLGMVVSLANSRRPFGAFRSGLNYRTATTCRLLLPCSHVELDSIPKARDQVPLSLLAGPPPLLEANARYL